VLAAVRLPESRFDPRDPFGELRELTRQAGGVVVGELEQRRDTPEAGTYIGRGKLEELRGLCETLDAGCIIFDHDLSPKQIASIERATERKVLDRSELILDIFASRATTHEAKLQVEIAQLEYTFPRLRAMWDHLERIVGSGGIGGVGTRGPGEQQLEIDRRLVQRRKTQLQRELRAIQDRKRRQVRSRKERHFTVGLVGYTNAGKSTLFNALTAGGAYADDRVFATLMTRTREWELGGGATAMLSDTVGFVRDLPHHLVASFRATLEEATHADVLLIVLDISDPAAELHYETVMRTLDEVFEDVRLVEERARATAERNGESLEPWQEPERMLLLNKADRLADNRELVVWQQRLPGSIPLCALPPREGETVPMGQEEIRRRIHRRVAGAARHLRVTVPLHDSKAISEIERRGSVTERAYNGDSVTLGVTIGLGDLRRIGATADALRATTADGEPVPLDRPAADEDGWSADRNGSRF